MTRKFPDGPNKPNQKTSNSLLAFENEQCYLSLPDKEEKQGVRSVRRGRPSRTTLCLFLQAQPEEPLKLGSIERPGRGSQGGRVGAAGAWVETGRAPGRSGLTTARRGGERHFSPGPPAGRRHVAPGAELRSPASPSPVRRGRVRTSMIFSFFFCSAFLLPPA